MIKGKLVILFSFLFLIGCENYNTNFYKINIPEGTLVKVYVKFFDGNINFTARFARDDSQKDRQFLVLKRYDNEECEGIILVPSPGKIESVDGGEKIFICKDDILAIEYFPETQGTEDNYIYVSPELMKKIK